MDRNISRVSCWAGCLGLVLLCGCTRKWDEGGATHYSFDLWVGVIVLLVSLASVVAGWVARGNRLGWGLVIAGVVGLLFFAPGMFLDRVILNDQGFTLRTGFWFAPTRHDVKFSEINAIHLSEHTRRSRRGPRTSYNLNCYKSDGSVHVVPVGTLMKEVYEEILDKASRRGIVVTVFDEANDRSGPDDLPGYEGNPPTSE